MSSLKKFVVILVIALTLGAIFMLQWFKVNVSLFDLLAMVGVIDPSEVAQYKQLEAPGALKSSDWTPADIISLIGTVGQIIVGLTGSAVALYIGRRNRG